MHPLSRFDDLPPQLTVLKLPAYSINSGVQVRQIPSRVEDLGRGLLSDQALVHLTRDWTILPRLVDFPCSESFPLDNVIFKALCSYNKSLPDNMRSLEVDGVPPELVFSSLPQNLKILIFRHNYMPSATTHWITRAHWPHSLTELTVSMLDWKGINSSSIWPPSLTFLTIEADPIFGVEHFHLLSRHLKVLFGNLRYIASRTPHFHRAAYDKLSAPQVKALGRTVLDTFEKQTWSRLKMELEKDNYNAYCGRGETAIEYFEAIESGAHFGLPLSLTHLKLSNYVNDLDLDILLPPRLCMLYLGTPAKSSYFYQLFPPFLTELHLNASVHPLREYNMHRRPTDWSIYDVDAEDDDRDANFFFALKLDKLCVTYFNSRPSSQDLYYIPHTVRDLSFRSNEAVLTGEIVTLMPPLLQRLDLLCSPDSQPSDVISALPKSLTMLQLNGIELSGEDMVLLPRQLETLTVGVVSTKWYHVLLHLPRRLRYTAISMNGDDQERHDKNSIWISPGDLVMIQRAYIPFYRLYKAPRNELEALIGKNIIVSVGENE